MTLSPEEFLRRFLQHVLPKGFPRIRYFGWLANRARKQLLPLCRHFLHHSLPATEASLIQHPCHLAVPSLPRTPCAWSSDSPLPKSPSLRDDLYVSTTVLKLKQLVEFQPLLHVSHYISSRCVPNLQTSPHTAAFPAIHRRRHLPPAYPPPLCS
jgi:hypothetical protein